jgi:hypothetical protein
MHSVRCLTICSALVYTHQLLWAIIPSNFCHEHGPLSSTSLSSSFRQLQLDFWVGLALQNVKDTTHLLHHISTSLQCSPDRGKWCINSTRLSEAFSRYISHVLSTVPWMNYYHIKALHLLDSNNMHLLQHLQVSNGRFFLAYVDPCTLLPPWYVASETIFSESGVDWLL